MSSEPRWIPRGNFEPLRYRPGGIGNWSGHLPFASDLIAVLRPKLFVELGTHFGESYFGFCQAIAEQSVACSCYAVDNWLGEEQAGFYSESVYRDVAAYNEAHYSHFSYLLRMTFDEALKQFDDASIDLLHIDGLHTYDAVSHDFHAWLPKVRAGGVILLHDIAARHADFGAWKLWEELEPLGDRFSLLHSWGLGVFRKPTAEPVPPDILSSLFHGEAAAQQHLRKFYSLCALKLEHENYAVRQAISAEPLALTAQVFPKIGEEYSLQFCYRSSFQSGQWQRISVELSAGIGDGVVRVDLTEQPCIIDIAGIALRRAVDGEVVWQVKELEIASLQVDGDMSLLAAAAPGKFCRFLSKGNDPQLYLPAFTAEERDQPLYLDIWVRAITETGTLLRTLTSHLQDLAGQFAVSQANAQPNSTALDDAVSECNAALDRSRAAYDTLLKENEQLIGEQRLLEQSYRKLQGDLYVAKVDLQNQAAEYAAERSDLVHARNTEAEQRHKLESSLHEVLTSRSWRITEPLRRLRDHTT